MVQSSSSPVRSFKGLRIFGTGPGLGPRHRKPKTEPGRTFQPSLPEEGERERRERGRREENTPEKESDGSFLGVVGGGGC